MNTLETEIILPSYSSVTESTDGKIPVEALRAIFDPLERQIVTLTTHGYRLSTAGDVLHYSKRYVQNKLHSNYGRATVDKIYSLTGWRPRKTEEIALWMYREGIIDRIQPTQHLWKQDAFDPRQIRIMHTLLSGVFDRQQIARQLGYTHIHTADNVLAGYLAAGRQPVSVLDRVEHLTGVRPETRLGAGMAMVACGYIAESIIGSALPVPQLAADAPPLRASIP